MALTLDDPLVRVQLFRFIDAMPALKDAGSIRRHLAEYLAEAGDAVPWWLSLALRTGARGHDAGGVAGRDGPDGRRGDGPEVHRRGHARRGAADRAGLRRRKLAFTADLLGEAIISEAEADWYQQTCLAMIDELAGPLAKAPEVPLIDRDQHGPIPQGQPLAQALEPDRPLRADPRRGVDRARRRPAPARSSARPASGGPMSTWTWSSTLTGH